MMKLRESPVLISTTSTGSPRAARVYRIRTADPSQSSSWVPPHRQAWCVRALHRPGLPPRLGSPPLRPREVLNPRHGLAVDILVAVSQRDAAIQSAERRTGLALRS